MLHLLGDGQEQGFAPGSLRRRDRLAAQCEELPDVVAAIRVTAGAGEDRPVGELASLVGVKLAVPGVELSRMILVSGLGVEAWLHGPAGVVSGDPSEVLMVY